MAVLNRLVRLSYWDRVQSVLPEEFRVLLPPKPEVRLLGPLWARKLPVDAGPSATWQGRECGWD